MPGEIAFTYEFCPRPQRLIEQGLLTVGYGTRIDGDVWLCHPKRDGKVNPVVIGKNCVIRSGTVIYSGVQIGDNVSTGHHVVIRENCRIGDGSSIGTGVKVEMDTLIGRHVSIESQSHITGCMVIEDYVFVGGCVMTTNDKRMTYSRAGHGQELKGPTLKFGCRIGSGAILLPGVTVGRHSVVNVGEIVRADVPDETLYFSRRGENIYRKIKPDQLKERD